MTVNRVIMVKSRLDDPFEKSIIRQAVVHDRSKMRCNQSNGNMVFYHHFFAFSKKMLEFLN